jgi:transglutaminase-like putative cysteine protease
MTGESTSSEAVRLPWTLVGALLVAMTAHWFTVDGFVGLPLCGLALLSSQFTLARLPSNRGLSWSIRAIVATFITMVIGVPRESVYQWYVKPEYTHLIGCLLSAEVAIRAWERWGPGRVREARGVMLLLAILIFAVATNTGVRTYIHRLAPPFALLIVLSVRSFSASPKSRAPLVLMRGGSLLAAIAVGWFIATSITIYDMNITSWAVDLLGSRRTRASEIGLSGSPRLGTISNPAQSMERVLLINGQCGERYLRAIAFDVLENRQWKRTLRERNFRQVDPAILNGGREGVQLTFTRIGETLDLLPIPVKASNIDVTRTIETDDSGGLRDQDTGLIGAPSRYVVVASRSEKFQGPLMQAMSAAQAQRALSLPDDLDPKVVEIARQIAGEGDSMTRVARLAMHLRATHEYSLSYNPGGGDPLSDFVLNRRAAHCQYFASALVVMSRAVGIPARFVTGYYAHEGYGDDTMVVRQRDAHAWAECWIEGVGWVTFDATPSGGRPDQSGVKTSSLRKAWEWISDLPGRLRDWLAQFNTRTLTIVIVAAALLLPALSLIRYLLKRRRKSSRASEYTKPREELLIIGRRFEQWLRGQNVTCAPNRTWREHVAVINPLCNDFVEVYDQARFGGADGEAIARANVLLDQLEQEGRRVGTAHH